MEGRYGGEFHRSGRRPATAVAGCECRPDCDLAPVVPYFALRSYTDNGQHYNGQIGSEATTSEYVDSLIACTQEWVRVLKPAGSIWLNLGDKYGANSWPSKNGTGATGLQDFGPKTTRVEGQRSRAIAGGRDKCLMGLPWRYALRCIDELGLILRAEVIWSKPNGLPESVTDRVRRSHEQWFHMVRQPRYYAAVDRIRQPHAGSTLSRNQYVRDAGPAGGTNGRSNGTLREARIGDLSNPLGALPGSVWTIPTQPLTVPDHLGVDHFAAFPMEWPRRLILGWSPSGICTACSEGRRPVVSGGGYDADMLVRRGTASQEYSHRTGTGGNPSPLLSVNLSGPEKERYRIPHRITGEACACPDTTPHPTRPAIVLDPFGGTGTTALVAAALGRVGISVDMSADYCRLAAWRTSDPGQRAAALQVDKPPVQVVDQLSLFDVGKG